MSTTQLSPHPADTPLHHLNVVETILRSRHDFFTEIREGFDVTGKIISMVIACLVFLAIDGMVMGAAHSIAQAISSAIKVPILFLVTLAICVPSLHYFNILFGSRQTVQQTIALILTGVSVTSVLLFSFAPITLFFLLTSSQYEFFKLLNVVLFAIAGLLGVGFLRQGMSIVTEAGGESGVSSRRLIFLLWVLLYGFVGSQMAWTLRPFMGMPDRSFIVFEQLGGNFYTDILQTLGRFLGL